MITEYKALALSSYPYWFGIVGAVLLRIAVNGDFSLQVLVGFPALLTVTLLIGYALCRVLGVRRANATEMFTLRLVTGLTAMILSSLLLLLCQFFNLYSLVALLSIIAIIGNVPRASPPAEIANAPASAAGFFLAMIALVALFGTPFEYIWGGTDAAVYIFNAHNFLNKDSISFIDPAVQLFPELFNESSHPNYEALKYAGFYLTDVSASVITPQFFPGYSLLLAVGILFLGELFLYVNLMLLMLLFLALYSLTRQLFSTDWIAWATAILFVVNLQVVWSARITHTEILTAIAAIMVLYLLIADDIIDGGSEKLIVAFYGLLLVTRVDVVFFTVAMLSILLVFESRYSRSFKAAFIGVSIASYFFMLQITGPYIRDIYLFKFAADANQVYLGISIALVVLLLLSQARAATYLVSGSKALFFSQRRWFSLVGVATIVTVFGFLLFIYPDDKYATYTSLQHLGNPLPTFNNQNFLRLSWFISPLGVFLMMTGLCLLLIKEQNWRWLIVALFFFPSLYYLYSLSNNPLQIYGFRRYVPGVLVLTYLCIGYALHSLHQRSRAASALVFLILTSLTAYPTYKLSSTGWFRGATASISDLAVVNPSDAIFVAKDNSVAHWHAPTLEYYLGFKHVLPVNVADLDQALIDKAKQHFDSIFLLTGDAIPSEQVSSLEKIKDVSIVLPVLQQSYESLVIQEQTYRRELALYRIL